MRTILSGVVQLNVREWNSLPYITLFGALKLFCKLFSHKTAKFVLNRLALARVGRPLLCLAAAQKITHAAHSLSRLGEFHVKAGYVSTLLAG